MSFTKLSAAALALASLTTAMPTTRATSGNPIYLSAEGYPALTLNLLHTGAGEAQGAFERPAAYSGTPAYVSDTYLNFAPPGSQFDYSATFADVGDNYGTKTPFYATIGPNGGRKGFSISSDGVVVATPEAALDSFYACNTTINNEPILGLFWGVSNSDGTPPADCVLATLRTQAPQ